jgi:hypothetical protein
MPTIDTKLKIALMGVATKLLTAQATKFQSMLLKMKDEYLVKLQEEGINQITEKGPTIVCPIIIPEIEKILPKLNTLRGIVSNMDKLSGTINDITTKIDKPIQVVNTAIPVLELSVTAIPVPAPPGVLLGVSKALDILGKLLDGLETGVNSLSSTSGIIVKYVQILDNLLQTIENTLLQIVNLCASNFNDEQEAELINNIRNALLFDPENANSTLEEDTAVDNELEEQLTNGDLTYQGFKLTIEYDPTPTTLLPSKRIKAVGLADTSVEILVEGGEADIPIEGIELYYPIPLPLSEEEIQELQSQGNFYDSSYTYSSNNKTLLTLIKNKIDNYLNGKTEEYVRYEVTFNYEQPDFRGQIQSQVDWLQNWQNQHTQLDLSDLIEDGQDLLEEIPDVLSSLSYDGTPLENGSVLNLPPGIVQLTFSKNLTFHQKYQNFLADKKLSSSNPTITSGNSILSPNAEIPPEGDPYYTLNVVNASTIDIIVETTGTKRGEDYYNFANFPNEGAIPFEEVPENIDTNNPPQIREYDGDEYTKGFYVWDVQEKRWELLDLKPFGYIEGVKDGDWKVKRENGENTYYEWYEGEYNSDGSIGVELDENGNIISNNYPHWVKKTLTDWKARTGNLWKLCSNFMALYNVSAPSTGVDETCVIYYISNENDFNVDTYSPIDTLRGAIWRWNEELVRWLPQNLGTALNYTKPTDNKYWDPEFWDNSTKKLSFQIDPDDIPDDGKWPTILPSDVDNSLDNFLLNGSITKSIIDPLDYKLSFLLLLLGPIGALGGPAILALIEKKIRDSVEDKYGKDSAKYENSKNYKYLQKPPQQDTPVPSYTDIPSPKRKYTNVFPPTKRYDNLSNSNFAEKQAQLAKKLFEGRR